MLPDAASLVTVLIESALKGLIVLAVAAFFAVLLRRSSAASRHWVWTLALASLIALPLLAPFVPAWQVPLLPERMEQHLRTAPLPPDPVVSLPPVAPSPPDAPSPAPSVGPVPVPAPPVEPAPASDAASAPVPAPAPATVPEPTPDEPDAPAISPQLREAGTVDVVVGTLKSWGGRLASALSDVWTAAIAPLRHSTLTLGEWVAGLWLLGLILALGRMVMGTVGVRVLIRRSAPVTEHAWSRDLVRFAGELGVSRPVALRRSLTTTMPLTCGVLRPFILLPADYTAWSPERRRFVLLHELAHIRRRDCLTQRIGQLAAAVYWFNPLVWIAVRWQRMEHERACDDLVLAQGVRPSTYAQELLDLARSFVQVKWTAPVTVSVAHKTDIERRMEAILDPKRSRRSLSRRAVYATAFLVACLLVPAAALHLGNRTTATQEMLSSPRIATFTEPPAPAAPPEPVAEPVAEPEGPFCRTLEREVSTADDVRIDVQNARGRIGVEAGSAAVVAIEAETCAPTRALLEETEVVVDARLRDVIVRTEQARPHADVRVSYLLRVPPTARLRRIDQQSGEIYLAHLDGPVSAELRRGVLHAVDLAGELRLSTIDAGVELDLGDRTAGAPVLVESVSGPIAVRINRPVSADLQARTVDGQIETTLGLIVEDDPGGRAVRARLGEGGAPVLVRNVEGGIRIERAEQVELAVTDQTRPRSTTRSWRRVFRNEDAEHADRFDRAWTEAGSAAPAASAVWVEADRYDRLRMLDEASRLEEPRRTRLLGEVALHDPDERMRLRAVEMLVRAEAPATRSVLFRLLEDSEGRVRAEAARVLGLRGETEAVGALSERVRRDPDARVRRAGVLALGQIADVRATAVIEEALRDDDRRVRRAAEQVLNEWARTTWMRTAHPDGEATYCRAGEARCAELARELRNLGEQAVAYSLAVVEEGAGMLGEHEIAFEVEVDEAEMRERMLHWVARTVRKVERDCEEDGEDGAEVEERFDSSTETLVDRALPAREAVEAPDPDARPHVVHLPPDSAMQVLVGRQMRVLAAPGTLP